MLIDYQDPRPVYEQIVDYYEKLIVSGALEQGDPMPSVRQMAADLSINPNTVQKAFTILEKTGFIYSVRGKGKFVADCGNLSEQKRAEWVDHLEKTLQEGRSLGVTRDACAAVLDRVYRGGEK